MKKERILKPDGRCLLYYSFDLSELVVPAGTRPAKAFRKKARRRVRPRVARKR